jgi:hypothetical protein
VAIQLLTNVDKNITMKAEWLLIESIKECYFTDATPIKRTPSFVFRADATMALLDALSGNTTARSVIERSLHHAFRRRYSFLTDLISYFDNNPQQKNRIEKVLVKYCLPPLRAMESRRRRRVVRGSHPIFKRATF